MAFTLDDVKAIIQPHHNKIMAESAAAQTERLLEEVVGHLGAAVVQLLPTDDQIIADHIKKAETLAVQALRSIQRRPQS